MIDQNDLPTIQRMIDHAIQKHTHKGIGSPKIPIGSLADLTMTTNRLIIFNPNTRSYLYISATN